MFLVISSVGHPVAGCRVIHVSYVQVKMQLRCIQCTLDFVQCIRDIHQLASVVHASFKASAKQWWSESMQICLNVQGQRAQVPTLWRQWSQVKDKEIKLTPGAAFNVIEYWWKHKNLKTVLFIVDQYCYQSTSVICWIWLFPLTRLQTQGAEGGLIIRVFVKEHVWYGQFVNV